ncbi:MAG: hypothetical protein NTY04_01550, partial [Candidatus Staskawiczbacteria bacterium]|nr:hypothetical protein [Candidatus Staskawiczbacteria bacterium]
WKANILTQLLISFAYLPMFHKLYVEKKKSDSYFAWVPNIFIASIAVYPAMVDGNSLSVIYSVRSFSLSLLTTLLLFYYQTRAKKVASAISK